MTTIEHRAREHVHPTVGEDLTADEYGEDHHGATDKQYIIIALILAADHGARGDDQLRATSGRSSCPCC